MSTGSLLTSSMESEERVGQVQKNEEKAHHTQTLSSHAFSDLSRISPVTFVFLLKEDYVRGTLKATKKFHVLHQQLLQALQNSPQPDAATFVIQSLYVFPVLGALYTEGFSHLVISALRRLQKIKPISIDLSESKKLAAQLFLDVIAGFVSHEDRILMKLLEVVDVRLENFGEAIFGPEANNESLQKIKTYVEPYIFGLIESQSYMMAVSLLERFSIRQSGEAFLMKMMQKKQFQAAEKWAAFMGKPLLCVLVQYYIDRKLVKQAYEIIKKNKLHEEFPNAYHMCKESSLKKLAEKGCWDVAEARTNNEKQYLEYLVYLAMEAGYLEKVDELCERYSLEGFIKAHEPEENLPSTRYLHLNELVLEDIIWVDEVDGLRSATSHIEGCKVIGVDCEWKPNYVKGSQPNKVSIMQIASEKRVFIFDLIKLAEDKPDVLDSCLKRILQSRSILKLGFNLQCDLNQLSRSYGEMDCFKHYEMLLDIQNVFKQPRGGLSGLAKIMKIPGRPELPHWLTSITELRFTEVICAYALKVPKDSWPENGTDKSCKTDMEYAALDAAVLVEIFRHVRSQPQPSGVEDDRQAKMEWKSYIVSHMDGMKKQKIKNKKTSKSKKEVGCRTDTTSG